MKVHRTDHVGVIVNDLPAAKAFFLDFGLKLQGEGALEGAWLDRVVGLNDVKASFAFFRVPDGQANIELIKFHTPSDENGIQQPLANTLGVRHIAFAVEDIEAVVAKLKEKRTGTFSEIQDFEGKYKLCYVRGRRALFSSWRSRSVKARLVEPQSVLALVYTAIRWADSPGLSNGRSVDCTYAAHTNENKRITLFTVRMRFPPPFLSRVA